MKLVKEFNNLAEAVDWAKDLIESPKSFMNELAGNLDKVKTTAPPAKEDKKSEVEKPAAAAAENGVSKLLVDLKEAGILLADFKPESRYAGVETALAWFGVYKIKDLKEEDQPKVLKMFNKMLKADKAGYNELLESLKQ